MHKKDYCTQNDGHCPSCSLVNYGRDCQNNPVNYLSFAAAALGRKGGQVKSDKKAESNRINGKKGGRPRKEKGK